MKKREQKSGGEKKQPIKKEPRNERDDGISRKKLKAITDILLAQRCKSIYKYDKEKKYNKTQIESLKIISTIYNTKTNLHWTRLQLIRQGRRNDQ